MRKKKRIDIDELKTSEIKYLAEEYIHHDRNKRIFLKRFINGMTIRAIADSEDNDFEYISEDQINRVIAKCLSKVLQHVTVKNGVLRVTD